LLGHHLVSVFATFTFVIYIFKLLRYIYGYLNLLKCAIYV
jgi:hypothetical protein